MVEVHDNLGCDYYSIIETMFMPFYQYLGPICIAYYPSFFLWPSAATADE